MKRVRTLIAALFLLCATAVNAQPMNYNAMRNNARFLTDRMAYTLGITTAAIIDDLYRINYDYICGVNDYLDDIALGYYTNEYELMCYERDRALKYLLGTALWNRLVSYDYFYRPISFAERRWRFSIYAYDTRLNHFYHTVPHYYNTYRGGHFFNRMSPVSPIRNYNTPIHYNNRFANNRYHSNGFVSRGYNNNNNNYNRGYNYNTPNVDRNRFNNNGNVVDRGVNNNNNFNNRYNNNNNNNYQGRPNTNARSDYNSRSSSRNGTNVERGNAYGGGTVSKSNVGRSMNDSHITNSNTNVSAGGHGRR